MSLLFLFWVFLFVLFLGVPGAYYLYMRRVSSRPWNLKVDNDYAPFVSIIIPTHNEEKLIKLKLENLWNVDYPKEKIQIILANDCSTDGTLQEARDFLNKHRGFNVEILDITERAGKSKALNLALKQATGEIIIVSDADCFLSRDILIKALPYLSDASVGAITGLELLLNSEQSWVTQTEITYNTIIHTIRIGESKTCSTIFFQGGFGAYKREFLNEFDPQTDDSGTALNIVQKKARTLLIPEALYFTTFPTTWDGKTRIKVRRATQLIKIWVKCLKLLVRQKLVLPKRVSLPETFLYIFNPTLFVLLTVITAFAILENPLVLLFCLSVLVPTLVYHKSRVLFVETIQDNFILLVALLAFILNMKFTMWKQSEGFRSSLTRDVLASKDLV